MKVCMMITNGFEELETIGTYAILKRGGIEVDIYSLKNQEATGRFGLSCTNLKDISEFQFNDYEALILPGGPQFEELEASCFIQEIIQTFIDEDKFICALCASPTILGRGNHLKGKQYTCFTSMNEDFGGTYIDQYVVRDNKIITGRSAAATIEFGFMILAALKGEKQAEKVKASIYY